MRFRQEGRDAADAFLSLPTPLCPIIRGSHLFGSAQGRLFARCAKDGAATRSAMPARSKAWAAGLHLPFATLKAPTSRKKREKWGTLSGGLSVCSYPAARYNWAARQPRAAVSTFFSWAGGQSHWRCLILAFSARACPDACRRGGRRCCRRHSCCCRPPFSQSSVVPTPSARLRAGSSQSAGEMGHPLGRRCRRDQKPRPPIRGSHFSQSAGEMGHPLGRRCRRDQKPGPPAGRMRPPLRDLWKKS